MNQEDQLFVIDWYTRADAFDRKDFPDTSDAARQLQQTQRLQKIIVPLKEAVEAHAKNVGPLNDQQRRGQSLLASGLEYKMKARVYDKRAQLEDIKAERRDQEGKREQAGKLRKRAQDYRQKAAAEIQKFNSLAQQVVEIDPSNVTAHRSLAEAFILKGEHQKALWHLALAVTHEKSPSGFGKTVAVAQNVKHPQIGNGWDFVITHLSRQTSQHHL